MKQLKTLMNMFGFVVLGCLLSIKSALAALPTPVAPSTGAPAGDWLGLIEGYAKDAGLVLGLVLALAMFMWIAWASLSSFNDGRTGKTEWGSVGLVVVVAVGIMIFVSFILTEASNVIT
jgi:integrating conjugative element membrane protein (TIGR03745 family)